MRAIRFAGERINHNAACVVLVPNAPPVIPWIGSGTLLEFIVSLYPQTRKRQAAAEIDVA